MKLHRGYRETKVKSLPSTNVAFGPRGHKYKKVTDSQINAIESHVIS